MNLINDPWITVRRRSGIEERIRPAQMASGGEADPVVNILAPRPDFRGALYQFLIGLLQTTFAPEDIDDWKARWDTPPTVEELDKVFEAYADAFELNGKGAAFMQDFDLSTGEEKYKEGDVEPISALIIDFPGNEFFLKKDKLNKLCEACSAQALLSFMLNASGSGRGHNMSVRGGGPVTTIISPLDSKGVTNSLWNKLWINVIPNDVTKQDVLGENSINTILAFPWMRSGKGLTVRPNEGASHPCQALWSMSQRVKLLFSSDAVRECDICGCQSKVVISSLVKRPDGIDFDGLWRNQLTPYDLLADELKGKKQAIKSNVLKKGYSHWANMLLGDEQRYRSSLTVSDFYSRKYRKTSCIPAVVWCFGFDMPKNHAKAACWYESMMPIFVRAEGQATLQNKVQPLLDVSNKAQKLLLGNVLFALMAIKNKDGYYEVPKWYRGHGFQQKELFGKEETEILDKKGRLHETAMDSLSSIAAGFWGLSESNFYSVLSGITNSPDLEDTTLAPYYKKWLAVVKDVALGRFDDWVIAAAIEDQNMWRVIEARENLMNGLSNAKPMQALRDLINPQLAIKKRMAKTGKSR